MSFPYELESETLVPYSELRDGCMPGVWLDLAREEVGLLSAGDIVLSITPHEEWPDAFKVKKTGASRGTVSPLGYSLEEWNLGYPSVVMRERQITDGVRAILLGPTLLDVSPNIYGGQILSLIESARRYGLLFIGPEDCDSLQEVEKRNYAESVKKGKKWLIGIAMPEEPFEGITQVEFIEVKREDLE